MIAYFLVFGPATFTQLDRSLLVKTIYFDRELSLISTENKFSTELKKMCIEKIIILAFTGNRHRKLACFSEAFKFLVERSSHQFSNYTWIFSLFVFANSSKNLFDHKLIGGSRMGVPQLVISSNCATLIPLYRLLTPVI